jgi:hypothetical protein
MTAATFTLDLPLQKLIDDRLDAIDDALRSSTARCDRLAILAEIETQIFELLCRRGSEALTHRDVDAVLAQLDPPAAYASDQLKLKKQRVQEREPRTRAARSSLTFFAIGIGIAALLLAMSFVGHEAKKLHGRPQVYFAELGPDGSPPTSWIALPDPELANPPSKADPWRPAYEFGFLLTTLGGAAALVQIRASYRRRFVALAFSVFATFLFPLAYLNFSLSDLLQMDPLRGIPSESVFLLANVVVAAGIWMLTTPERAPTDVHQNRGTSLTGNW